MRYHLTLVSDNVKTGPMPVATTSMDSCPESCGMRRYCYAHTGRIRIHWGRVVDSGMDLQEFCDVIRALPRGKVWRYGQAGDLPGIGDVLDVDALATIVGANTGRRGFAYTHKPLTTERERQAIKDANANGFIINLSADDVVHADRLVETGIAPVVTVLPLGAERVRVHRTPAGRRVVVCPAYTQNLQCVDCKVCMQKDRKTIVGFPVHGAAKLKYQREKVTA